MTQDAQSGNGDGSWKEWSRWVRVGAALATGLIQIIVHYVKKGGL